MRIFLTDRWVFEIYWAGLRWQLWASHYDREWARNWTLVIGPLGIAVWWLEL